jgi:hypothetical protein
VNQCVFYIGYLDKETFQKLNSTAYNNIYIIEWELFNQCWIFLELWVSDASGMKNNNLRRRRIMPGIKKNLDAVKKLSDTIVEKIRPQDACMSPSPPPKSDFKPTSKTQPNEFSQEDRELPKFRISSQSERRKKIVARNRNIGARNPYAMINAKLLM